MYISVSGLELHGFLDMMRQFKADAFNVLSPAKIKADELKEFFAPSYGPPGSNQRATEVTVVYNLHRFLKQVESKLLLALPKSDIRVPTSFL
jgi:hypothetical protein